jgi:hypothetical protein
MPRCALWITACVVLHNILIFLRDEYEFAEVPAAGEDLYNDVVAPQHCQEAKLFQNAVRDRWLKDVLGWR